MIHDYKQLLVLLDQANKEVLAFKEHNEYLNDQLADITDKYQNLTKEYRKLYNEFAILNQSSNALSRNK